MTAQQQELFNPPKPASEEAPIYLSQCRYTKQGVKKFMQMSGEGCYALHQLLYELFEVEAGGERPYLCTPPTGGIFYMISQEPPRETPYFQVQTREMTPQLTEGQPLHVRVWVNPTIQTRDKRLIEDGQPKRLAVDTYERIFAAIEDREARPLHDLMVEWMEARADKCGFTIERLECLTDMQRSEGRKRGRKIVVDMVQVEMRVRVTDVDAFMTVWREGLGRGKAFGAGMMLVKPAPQIELL